MVDFGLDKADEGPQWADFGRERANFGSERADFRPSRRKSVRWSAVPVPCLSWLWLKLRGCRAAAPKGSMTYALTHMGNFLLLLLGLDLFARILASRIGFGPKGWDLGLQARILALRLGFGPRG